MARPLRALVTGCDGRMGRKVIEAIDSTEGIELGHSLSAVDSQDGIPAGLDVAIDFTSPAGLERYAPWCAERGIALVSGTTGLGSREQQALQSAARAIPIVWSPNMSVGVNLLLELTARAVSGFGAAADVEVVEVHHRAKADAPSGTALRLLEAIAAARGEEPEAVGRFARHGLIGARPGGEVGVQTVRGGDVVGEHTVYLLGEGERLELVHRATDRGIFARGAVRAALWVVAQAPGLYGMQDVLGAVSR